MAFLCDIELKELILCEHPIITNIQRYTEAAEYDGVDSPIQPSSVDLRVDHITLPPENELERKDQLQTNGQSARRVNYHCVKKGEAIRVSLIEGFHFKDKYSSYGAILTAPARISRRGILFLDLGHIDPGFSGNIGITLVNVGDEPFEIKHGDSIVTALLFRTSGNVDKGLSDRVDGGKNVKEATKATTFVTKRLLDIEKIASDVAKIIFDREFPLQENKIKEITQGQVESQKAELWKSFILPSGLVILITIGLFVAPYYLAYSPRIDLLETQWKEVRDAVNSVTNQQLTKLAGGVGTLEAIDAQISDLKDKLKDFDRRFKLDDTKQEATRLMAEINGPDSVRAAVDDLKRQIHELDARIGILQNQAIGQQNP
jgi:deoxycytidine triphosphate deaminase